MIHLVYFLAQQNVHVDNTPTAGGLSTPDLIAILSIVVIIFGLLLSAIGVLLMTIIGNLRADMNAVRLDIGDDLKEVWRAIDALRTSTFARGGGRRMTDHPFPSPDDRD